MQTNFEPFQKVLVRNSEKMWSVSFYSHFHKLANRHCTVTGLFSECIDYAGNERLLGTTDEPEPKYKWGDKVEVEICAGTWELALYIDKFISYQILHSVYRNDGLEYYTDCHIRPLKQ